MWCHVGIHVDFTSIMHSYLYRILKHSVKWTWTSSTLFHQWQCLKCNGRGLPVSRVKWPLCNRATQNECNCWSNTWSRILGHSTCSSSPLTMSFVWPKVALRGSLHYGPWSGESNDVVRKLVFTALLRPKGWYTMNMAFTTSLRGNLLSSAITMVVVGSPIITQTS